MDVNELREHLLSSPCSWQVQVLGACPAQLALQITTAEAKFIPSADGILILPCQVKGDLHDIAQRSVTSLPHLLQELWKFSLTRD